MQINSAALTAANPATPSSPPSGSSGASATDATSQVDDLANSNTFLKLLVAQMQNQNPLNPADPTQFVSQLAQFSALEQTIAMRTRLDDIYSAIGALKPAAPAA